ncbi:hypothetical protein FJY94_03415 [Candidatus Kaiserbacteria bacterium]|nr:hypothetical protein [Candidatus Kaiserbacteria bacterium]
MTTNSCNVTFFTNEQPAVVSAVGGANITVTYDGTPKSVAFTTQPAGLPLAVTYDGSAVAPVNAGTYVVLATVTGGYVGTGSATLTILKAPQTISFASLTNKKLGSGDVVLSASSSSGLPVSFAASGACSMKGAATVRLDRIGTCTVTARQAGDVNREAAPDVVRSFAVTSGTPGSNSVPPYLWPGRLIPRIIDLLPTTTATTTVLPRDNGQALAALVRALLLDSSGAASSSSTQKP